MSYFHGPEIKNGILKPQCSICGLLVRGTGTLMYEESSPISKTPHISHNAPRICIGDMRIERGTRLRRASCRLGRQRRRKDIYKTATGFAGWSSTERGAGMRPAAASRTKEGSFVIYIIYFFLSLSQSHCREHRGVGDSGPESPTLRTYLFHYSFRLDNEIEI